MADPGTEAEILADLERYDAEPVNVDKAIHVPKQEKQSEPQQLPLPQVDKPEKPVEEQPTEDRPRDEFGRFLPKEAAPGDGGDVPSPPDETKPATEKSDQPAEDKPVDGEPRDVVGEAKPSDSKYEKAKKDAERRDRSWKALEEEKKRERESIAAEKAELARERQRVTEQLARAPKPDIIGYDGTGQPVYSVDALRGAAKAFEDQGDFEKAELARKAIPASERFEQHLAVQAFTQARDRVTQEAVASNPDIANPNTPIYKEMADIYDTEARRAREQNRRPLYELIPDFMPIAAEASKLRLDARSGTEWKVKYEQLLQRFEEQNKLLAVNGSSPTTPRPPKTFETMTTDEQLAAMDRAAGFTPYTR